MLQQLKGVLLWGCAQLTVLQPAAIRKTICAHFENILLHKPKSPDGSGFAPLPVAHLQDLAASKDAQSDQGLKPSAWLHYQYVHAPACACVKATEFGPEYVCVCVSTLEINSSRTCFCWEAAAVVTETGCSQGHVRNRLSCLGTSVLIPSPSGGQLWDLFPICCVSGYTCKLLRYWSSVFKNRFISAVYWRKPCWNLDDILKRSRCFYQRGEIEGNGTAFRTFSSPFLFSSFRNALSITLSWTPRDATTVTSGWRR